MALLLMPFAEADIRAPVSAQLSSTDATVQKSGSCVAEVTDAIAQLLYAKSEKRGESVRLDWSDDELKWHPIKMNTPEPKVDELIQCIRWHTPHGARFRHGSHINIQEVLACVLEAQRRGLEGQRDLRVVFILDSRVAIRGDFEREVFIEKFKPCCFAVALRVLEVWHPCGARVGFYETQPQFRT